MGHRRAARAHLQGAQVPPRCPRLAVGHPGARAARRRRARGRIAERDRGRRGRRSGQAPGSSDPYDRWQEANVVRGVDRRHRQRDGVLPARRHHRRPVPCPRRHPARLRARRPRHEPPEPRAARPHRSRRRGRCTTGSSTSAWPQPGAELARDVVSCPGADTCNLAVTQSRGLAAGDRRRARRGRPGRGCRACASTSPAARTAAASTTSPTSGSSGSSAARTAAPRPATRCCSAATSPTRRWSSARRPRRSRPRTRPRPSCGSCAASARSAKPARRSRPGSARSGGAKGVGDTLVELDHFPTPDVGPEFYVDYDETGPYVAEVGDGECAAT